MGYKIVPLGGVCRLWSIHYFSGPFAYRSLSQDAWDEAPDWGAFGSLVYPWDMVWGQSHIG